VQRAIVRWGADRLALLLFAALTAAAFWRLWAPNPADRAMIGAADGDFVRQFYPYRAFVAEAWASGQPPLWNPHQYAGTPAWADPQLAVLYPWRLLQVPLALGPLSLPHWAVQLEALAHVALGAWFAYLLARSLGAGAAGGVLAGLGFGLGGYLTGYPVEQLAVLDTAVWIPASLWALTSALHALGPAEQETPVGGRRPGPAPGALRCALAAGVATALSVLAGHPQTALFGLYAAAAWLAWNAVETRRPRAVGALAGAWLLTAAGLSAAQWLPSLGLLVRSAREISPAEVAAGLPAGDVVQLWLPGVVSHFSPLYVGVVPLVLAGWAAVRLRAALFWLALAAGGWLLALGGGQPAFPVLLRLLPGLGLFRHQERAAVLVSLGLAVAAGLALDALLARGRTGGRGVARAFGILGGASLLGAAILTLRPSAEPAVWADGLALSGLFALAAAAILWLGSRAGAERPEAAAALLALAALDLLGAGEGRALAPWRPVFEADVVVQALRPLARDGRVSSEGRLPGGANAASVWGLYDVTGDSPLRLALVNEAVERWPEIVWWRLLGVRYVVTDREFEPGSPVREMARTDGRALFEVELPAPPAWVPAAARPAPADGWAPHPGFDPLAEAIMGPRAEPVAGASGDAALTGLTNNSLSVEAEMRSAGLLVVSSAFDPGWRAEAVGADGSRMPLAVEPAYGLLSAVRLPAGRFTVEWTYRPEEVIVGLVVTVLSLGALAVGWRRWSSPRPSG
jgi:hypothetical protein